MYRCKRLDELMLEKSEEAAVINGFALAGTRGGVSLGCRVNCACSRPFRLPVRHCPTAGELGPPVSGRIVFCGVDRSDTIVHDRSNSSTTRHYPSNAAGGLL